MTTPHATPLELSWARSMAETDRQEWNRLTLPLAPFMRWEWLNLLETSGSVQPATGWMPVHCLLRRQGRLVAAAPFYVKGHGQGEFVYDTLWAGVADRLGLPYYPKLVAATPFTPVGVYRFLTQEGPEAPTFVAAMLRGMLRMVDAGELSGLHVLFAQDDFATLLEGHGLRTWEHQGFAWHNRGYASFADFLADFRAGQRRNILKERRALAGQGLRVVMVEGAEAPLAWFSLMYDYYSATNEKFGEWGCKYLTREFFVGLADVFREHLAFGAAFAPGGGEPVALSLVVKGGDTLYGRYWGAAVNAPFLHFELCYYAPIEYAIAKGFRIFDPGMGGEHKPRRGFRSRLTRSLHLFADPRLSGVFDMNIAQLNDMAREQVDVLNAMVCLKEVDCP